MTEEQSEEERARFDRAIEYSQRECEAELSEAGLQYPSDFSDEELETGLEQAGLASYLTEQRHQNATARKFNRILGAVYLNLARSNSSSAGESIRASDVIQTLRRNHFQWFYGFQARMEREAIRFVSHRVTGNEAYGDEVQPRENPGQYVVKQYGCEPISVTVDANANNREHLIIWDGEEHKLIYG